MILYQKSVGDALALALIAGIAVVEIVVVAFPNDRPKARPMRVSARNSVSQFSVSVSLQTIKTPSLDR